MLMSAAFRRFVVVALMVLSWAGPGWGQSGGPKVNLDPLLAIPGIWEKTPESIDAQFAGSGPILQWWGRNQGARDRAVFGRSGLTDISSDPSILGGKVPIETASLQFVGGKASRLSITLADPKGGLGTDKTAFETSKSAVVTGLNALFGTPGVSFPKLFGFKGERAVQSMLWKGAGGSAILDFSAEKNVLRLSLASPSTDLRLVSADPIRSLLNDDTSLFLNLDELLALPTLWELTPSKVESMLAVPGSDESPFYQWLTTDKSGVRFSRRPFSNVEVDLAYANGSIPVDEAVIEFANGKAAKVTASFYNRGDSGAIEKEEFSRRFKTAGVTLGKVLGVRPTERRPGAQTAVKISGWTWSGPTALAALEYNTGALEGAQAEFLRLRLAAPGARDTFASESGQSIRKTALGKSELPKFVKRETNGDVYVGGVPMVDQGDKGYCVVASCQRLFSYLRIPCDQHEIAQIAGSDAGRGTNSAAMEDALRKIDSRFKVNFKPLVYRLRSGGMGIAYGNRISEVTPAKFQKQIQDYTTKGVPLLWALELGQYPEEPPNAAQVGGGHMRMVLGLNEAKGELIFTDSWGAGHELKRMKVADAYRATFAMYVIEPKEY